MPEGGDHSPPAWVLDNPIRRWTSPPRRVVDRLDPRPGDHVVDIGAGVGYYADPLLARVGPTGRLTLVDINAKMLQRYLDRHGPDPRLRTVVGSAASLPGLASGSADRVLSSMMLCDLNDKKGVLDEVWRLLRPGGVAYVSFHAAEAPVPSRPLWVTPQLWSALRAAHAWEVVAHGERGSVRWHLLRKPGPPGDLRPGG